MLEWHFIHFNLQKKNPQKLRYNLSAWDLCKQSKASAKKTRIKKVVKWRKIQFIHWSATNCGRPTGFHTHFFIIEINSKFKSIEWIHMPQFFCVYSRALFSGIIFTPNRNKAHSEVLINPQHHHHPPFFKVELHKELR